MASVLSSFFARDPKAAFGYDLPAQPSHVIEGISIGDSFKKAEKDELASVFWSNSYEGVNRLKALTQKLKTMRHPNILTFFDSLEIDNSYYLITERCLPLSVYLQESPHVTEHKELVVSWGVFQIMSTLKFLHEANIDHGRIRHSVYVTAAGDWKISELQETSQFRSPTADFNQLAILIWEVFNSSSAAITKPPDAPGRIPNRLHKLYKALASNNSRTTASELIKESRSTGGFFKNKFVDTLLFLEEFQLKEPSEKQAFFHSLRENLDIFPDDIAKYKILPKLIMTYEYGDAGPNIMIPLFKLGRLLAEDEYQRRIVPCLVKLFGSPDRTTRVKLLERIDEFAPHLTPAVINEKIFSNLCSGFMDTSPAVRESTVKAMVSLAEKLNYNNLNTELMKYLARLQGGDENGGIRTNATICLGKIGHLLAPAKRQTILLSAFGRGMKDPFPPARMAAVLALAATQQFYTIIEIANRVLPALAPLTCDPEKQVRDQAFKTIRGFLEKLEKASENPETIPELEAQVNAGGSSLLSSEKVPQWASWALKSLSGKFYKGTPPPTQQSSSTAKPEVAESSATAISTPKEDSKSRSLTPPISSSSSNVNGWGDEDQFDDANDWNDAGDVKSSVKADDDEEDWSSGWEAQPKSTLSTVQKKTENLKLTTTTAMTAKKPAQVVKPQVKSGWEAEEKSVANSGWEQSNDGWDTAPDFGAEPVQTRPSSSQQANKDKEARRAELAARNEARKKELAEKRAARGGAMKLGGVAKAEKKMDDFSDW